MDDTKSTEATLGTLYDMNKSIVQSSLKKLTPGIINSKKEEIKNFLRKHQSNYYMLLCHEQRDYTLFNLGYEKEFTQDEKYKKLVSVLIDECLYNRGEVRGIDVLNDKDNIEIWLSIDDDSYAYYFFPYDAGVIDIETELGGNHE